MIFPGRPINLTRRSAILLASAAVLAPLAYLLGRYGQGLPNSAWHAPGSLLAAGGLGGLLMLPVGLLLGSLRSIGGMTPATTPNGIPNRRAEILAELRNELVENQQLLAGRKGSLSLVARLDYVTSYWASAQASGQLSGIFRAHQLSEIAVAYYWLDQASHLERLAYDAKNGGTARDPEFTVAKLISEIRLLDEPIERAITAALGAIADAE